MRYQVWHRAVLTLVVAVQASLGTTQVHASGLCDWLSRGGQPAPQVVYYPGYQTAATECCEPVVSYQSPDPCCTPMAVVQPRPSFWQRMGACWAQPPAQTRYRTSWRQVPVTSYRPAMATDPATGCPVTVMKPCSTYAWQADRIGCGLFSGLFGGGQRSEPQVQYCVPAACYAPSDCGVGMTSDCCGSTVTSSPLPESPAPTPAPYYSPAPPAGSTFPSGGSTSLPSVLTEPPAGVSPTLAPGTPPPTSPPSSTLSPGALRGTFPAAPGSQPPAAADTRPTLKPVDPVPAESAGAAPPATGLPGSEAPSDATLLDNQSLQPMPSLSPPIVNPESSRLSPIPGPTATPVTPADGNSPPPLLSPRDQMASLRTGQHWAVVPVTARRPPAAAPRQDLRARDESGWQSARKAP